LILELEGPGFKSLCREQKYLRFSFNACFPVETFVDIEVPKCHDLTLNYTIKWLMYLASTIE
jgi:hypothetical protein